MVPRVFNIPWKYMGRNLSRTSERSVRTHENWKWAAHAFVSDIPSRTGSLYVSSCGPPELVDVYRQHQCHQRQCNEKAPFRIRESCQRQCKYSSQLHSCGCCVELRYKTLSFKPHLQRYASRCSTHADDTLMSTLPCLRLTRSMSPLLDRRSTCSAVVPYYMQTS